MNREIKFRAWNRIVSRMEPPFTIEQLYNVKRVQFQNLDFLKFTGYRSNIDGREVYEGDILEITGETNTGSFKKFTGVVVDKMYGGMIIENGSDFMELGLKRYDYKILGNIFQNPELLKHN